MTGWLNMRSYGKHSRQWLGHSFRYYLARGYIEPTDTVLDVACGCGYGSQILSAVADRVISLDNDAQALDMAVDRYNADNILYMLYDIDYSFTLPEADVVVSFETIEHLEREPEHFAKMLKSASRRLIIMSAPIIPTVHRNPHHRHDFTQDQLYALMLDEDWILWESVKQGPYLVMVIYDKHMVG